MEEQEPRPSRKIIDDWYAKTNIIPNPTIPNPIPTIPNPIPTIPCIAKPKM